MKNSLSWIGTFSTSMILFFGWAYPSKAQAQTVLPDSFSQSLLWEISGEGDLNTSYLFGTIHIIGEDDFFIPKGTKECFDACEVLALEIDMDNPMEILRMAMGGLNSKQSVEDLLEPEDFERVKTFMLDSINVSEAEFNVAMRMQPLLASSIMYPKMIDGPTVGYEEEFMAKAKKRDMKIVGLESVKKQLDVISEIPIDVQVEMLMAYVDSFDTQKQLFEDMVTIYRAQDLPTLAAMMNESEDLGEFEEVMLNGRNRDWIPEIGKLMKNNPTFIAVGAAHLWGTEGVIQLLRKEGYTVKPVRYFKETKVQDE